MNIIHSAPSIDLEVNLGDLGRWPLRFSMVPHEGKLEIGEVFLRTPQGCVSMPALDLLADTLGISLDELLPGGTTEADVRA